MEIKFFRGGTGCSDFLKTKQGEDFTGIIFDYTESQNCYKSQYYNSQAFCIKQIYKNGKLHSTTEPAYVYIQQLPNGLSDSSLCSLGIENAYTIIFYLFGYVKTKKAWEAIILDSKNDEKAMLKAMKSDFQFNGSFFTKQFEFHGYKNMLIAVRHGNNWFTLNKGSRVCGTFTRKINSIVPTNRTEVSQAELEKMFTMSVFSEAFE